MPRVSTVDVGHTQDSDHRILRVPAGPHQGASLEPQLTRFPPVKEEDSLRGLALAWVSLGGSGSQHAIAQAEKILPQTLAQKPDDPELLAALAFEEQQKGLTDQAREHYLARAMCLTGHGEESKVAIARVLEFNPDLSAAREMLKQLESGEVTCDLK
jgi:hypothetical protein